MSARFNPENYKSSEERSLDIEKNGYSCFEDETLFSFDYKMFTGVANRCKLNGNYAKAEKASETAEEFKNNYEEMACGKLAKAFQDGIIPPQAASYDEDEIIELLSNSSGKLETDITAAGQIIKDDCITKSLAKFENLDNVSVVSEE